MQDFMTAVADIAAKSGAITFRSQKSSRNRANSVFPCNKWFDQECKDMIRKVNDQLKTWRQDRDRATFKCYLDLKKAYKKLIRRKKREQNTCFNTMLRDLNTTNPTKFWKLLGFPHSKFQTETLPPCLFLLGCPHHLFATTSLPTGHLLSSGLP